VVLSPCTKSKLAICAPFFYKLDEKRRDFDGAESHLAIGKKVKDVAKTQSNYSWAGSMM